jgi:glycosyltransferase involved in cell wall biosynthesis
MSAARKKEWIDVSDCLIIPRKGSMNVQTQSPFKLCYLADAPSVHTQKWAHFFAERGNDVHIISFRPAAITGVQVHYVATPLGKLGYLLGAGRIRKLVQHIAPDILHAHHATSYGLMGAMADYHPYIISSWGSDVIWSPHQFFVFDRILRYNFRRADMVTATSRMLAEATAIFCPPVTKVHIIPFGVDTNAFAPSPRTYQNKSLIIGTVKTLRPRYGIRELILAFQRIADAFPTVRLMIVGGGEQHAELQALLVNLNLENRITLTGQVDHKYVPEYLRSFDIFVVPSLTHRESFGVAAVEASASGLPVVASQVGGLPEVVLDGKTGLLVPPGDIDALATAISRLLADSALRARMGQAGRQFVLDHYRWEDNAKLMEQLYNKVLNSRSTS